MALDQNPVLYEIVDKEREMVSYFKSSTIAKVHFTSLQCF